MNGVLLGSQEGATNSVWDGGARKDFRVCGEQDLNLSRTTGVAKEGQLKNQTPFLDGCTGWGRRPEG